ncbi:MAG: SRPBCC family protein [Gemmatirosa sp.]
MTARSVTHASFTLERSYDAPPARVFRAFADPAAKALWFQGPPAWGPAEVAMDFRVGGRETSRTGPPGGPVHSFDCLYQDIVPDARIVYSYTMDADDTRTSASLAVIELTPAGSGTRLTLTEHGVFLDGHDTVAQREEGTNVLLDALGESLHREPAVA